MTRYHVNIIEAPERKNVRAVIIHSEATLEEVAGMIRRLIGKEMLKHPIPEGKETLYSFPDNKTKRRERKEKM